MESQQEGLAQIIPLPKNKLMTIEYPGYVVSQSNAVRTLGGNETVTKAFNERPESMEVNFVIVCRFSRYKTQRTLWVAQLARVHLCDLCLWF